jgi:uncharacterized repeat protein (TIGR01451 family)
MTKTKNSNLFYNLISCTSKRLAILLTLTGVVLTGITAVFIQLPLPISIPVYAASNQGNTTNGTNFAIDKKYNDQENITVNGGDDVTVKLFYENTGGMSVTNAAIRDALPFGFDYVDGSMRNCINPSASEITCDGLTSVQRDSAFDHLIGSGVSPIWGLYDQNVKSEGFLPYGRKRYVQFQTDSQPGIPSAEISCALYAHNISTFQTVGQCNNGSAPFFAEFADTLGKRYLQVQNNFDNNVPLSEILCGLVADNNQAISNQGAFCSQVANTQVFEKVDIVANRYLQLQNDYIFGNGLSYVACKFKADNNPTFTDTGFCEQRNSHSNNMKIDLIDTSRGRGYMEYRIKARTGFNGTVGAETQITQGINGGFNRITTNAVDSYTPGSNNSIKVVNLQSSITNSNITSTTCTTPNTSTASVYTNVLCTANFSAGKTGNITFVAQTDTVPVIGEGGCITESITANDTSKSCSFRPSTNPSGNTPMFVYSNASNGGTLSSNNRSNNLGLNSILCEGGKYSNNGNCESICPANNFCPGIGIIVCPNNGLSPAGSAIVEMCVPNSVSIDKKYVYNGNESDMVNVPNGATFKVLLKYDNSGGQSMSDVQIKDSLPAGFNYVPGSMKNCIIPSSNSGDSACDNLSVSDKNTLFGKLTGSGAGALSGLYNTGVSDYNKLLPGKKRYLQIATCTKINNYDDTFSNHFSNVFEDKVTDRQCADNTGGVLRAAYALDNVGKRYMQVIQCNTGSYNYDVYIRDINLSSTSTSVNTDCGGGVAAINNSWVLDSLDNRFLQIASCHTTSGINYSDISNLRINNVAVGDIDNQECQSTYGVTSSVYYSGAIDSLDTTRGKGYFEYQVTAPATGNATVGTDVIIRSAIQTGNNPLITPIVDTGSYNLITLGTGGSTSGSTKLNAKLNLSGAFDILTQKMRTDLKQANLIPASQPFGTYPATSPLYYTGTETVVGGSAAIPADCVDWILVDVKNSTNNTSVFKKAMMLDSNGTVFDPTDSSQLTPSNRTGFTLPASLTTGTYNITVRHRNHIAVSNNTPITITAGSTSSFDFTGNGNVKSSNQTVFGTSSIYGMIKGNSNGDDSVAASDRNQTRLAAESSPVYSGVDLNLDGSIDSTDRNISRLAVEVAEDVN